MRRIVDLSPTVADGFRGPPSTDAGVRFDVRTKPGYWQSSLARLSVHTGCHVECELHVQEDGRAIDALPLERVIGSAVVLDLTPPAELAEIGPDDLTDAALRLERAGEEIRPGDIVLLWTGWADSAMGAPEYFSRSPGLTAEAAEWLVARRPGCIGCDFFEEPAAREPGWEAPDFVVHRTILGAGVPLVEGLVGLGATAAALRVLRAVLQVRWHRGRPGARVCDGARMKLTNEITVPASIEEAWDLMLDVERVAPCLPGASIDGSEGDEYKGSMKVKIGPIVSQFNGTLKIDEADEEAHRAVMSAKARDSRGKGSATATITSTLGPADEGTRVTVETDLRVTGPAASFGRGVMQDVSAMLMTQFADCLATKLGREAPAEAAAPETAETAPAAPAADGDGSEDGEPVARAQALPEDVPEPPPAQAEAPAPAPEPAEENVLDLGAVGREAIGRRAAPPAVAVILLAALLVLLLRRRRG